MAEGSEVCGHGQGLVEEEQAERRLGARGGLLEQVGEAAASGRGDWEGGDSGALDDPSSDGSDSDGDSDASGEASTEGEGEGLAGVGADPGNGSGEPSAGKLSKAEKKRLRALRRREGARLKKKANKLRRREKARQRRLTDPVAPPFRVVRPDLAEHLRRCQDEGLNVAIDLDFARADLQNERELSSLAKQVVLAYAYIKRARAPLHLHLCPLAADSPLFDNLLGQGMGAWAASRHLCGVAEVFPAHRLVYLSPDAEEPLETFDTSKVYVIGGIVDRTVKKSWSLAKARTVGVECRRLPLQEHVSLRQSHVLNVDHVVTIIGEVLAGKSWAWALEHTVPQRKIGASRLEAEVVG